MDMIFTDHTPDNLYLKIRAGLSDQFSGSLRYIPLQYLVTIFRYPHKMIFNLVLRM